MKKLKVIVCFLALCFIFLSTDVFAQIDLKEYCSSSFRKTQSCPEELCKIKGGNDSEKNVSVLSCVPKLCTDISSEHCPIENGCEVLIGCDEKKRCYFKQDEPACGELAYSGQTQCCEGFIKRCGINFFDGSCDMVGLDDQYRLPICVPCGNGICNQFENHCNCPEDCKDVR